MPDIQKNNQLLFLSLSILVAAVIVSATILITSHSTNHSMRGFGNHREMGMMKGRMMAPGQPMPSQPAMGKMASSTFTGRVLATSPDQSFVLRGTDACKGEYQIIRGQASMPGAYFNLSHPITLEDSDLGAVSVQTPAERQQTTTPFRNVAFVEGERVVSYSMKEPMPGDDCKVWIAPR